MDAGGNVLREVIVRKGVVGYKKDEKPGRMTLLYEGSTLAKMLLLVLVVYTYYIAPWIEDSSELKLLFSVGFFVSIALAALPLVRSRRKEVEVIEVMLMVQTYVCVFMWCFFSCNQLRNVMGAHYMFLANMLHLDSIIYLHGSRKGVVCDAPLGFIVLATRDNTKTFIPAGGTVSHTTEVFHKFLWPLRLDVRLPVHTSARRVREFVQDIDRLLFWDPVVVIAPDGTAAVLDPDGASSFIDASPQYESGSARGFTSAAAAEMATRLLFDENRQEEERIVRRARGNEGFVALEANKRWVVQFRTFVQATEKTHFRQTRAAVSVGIYFVIAYTFTTD